MYQDEFTGIDFRTLSWTEVMAILKYRADMEKYRQTLNYFQNYFIESSINLNEIQEQFLQQQPQQIENKSAQKKLEKKRLTCTDKEYLELPNEKIKKILEELEKTELENRKKRRRKVL